jgi:hypothetical protein
MELIESLFIIIPLFLGIISFIFGIRFFIKYNQTRKKRYLFLGILLTFVVPAIIFYFIRMSTTVVYGPAPMMAYGPAPIF